MLTDRIFGKALKLKAPVNENWLTICFLHLSCGILQCVHRASEPCGILQNGHTEPCAIFQNVHTKPCAIFQNVHTEPCLYKIPTSNVRIRNTAGGQVQETAVLERKA